MRRSICSDRLAHLLGPRSMSTRATSILFVPSAPLRADRWTNAPSVGADNHPGCSAASRLRNRISNMSEAQMSNLIDRRTLIQATGASVVAGSVSVAQAAPTTGQSGGATDDLIVPKPAKGADVVPAIGL